MNLDDLDRFRQLDPSGMLEKIDELPAQLEKAWGLGQSLALPSGPAPRRLLIAGLGGSAIGADLLAAYAAPLCPIPITVWRDYDLPAWAAGAETLVIASSHSGNTEEVLSSFEKAGNAGASRLALTTGGELAAQAQRSGVALWGFPNEGPPRTAVGYSFGLLLALLSRLELTPDASQDVADAAAAMRAQQRKLGAAVPVVNNPAKRMGGQFMGRWPTILGAGLLAPVARRWRTQINELAKAVAQFEILPEADHNFIEGVVHPAELFSKTMALFLRASLDHPRNLARAEATRHLLMVEGFNTDEIDAEGDTRLAQQWTCLHYGDFVAYYLAMAYGVDPTPIPVMEGLKQMLKEGTPPLPPPRFGEGVATRGDLTPGPSP